jgi:hypothetical protein
MLLLDATPVVAVEEVTAHGSGGEADDVASPFNHSALQLGIRRKKLSYLPL